MRSTADSGRLIHGSLKVLARVIASAGCVVCLSVLRLDAYQPPYEPFGPVPQERPAAAKGGQSFLGIGVVTIDGERAKALGLDEVYGVEITRIQEDGPGARGGLKTGDVLLEYNGQRVNSTDQLVRIVRETPPGRDVRITVSRAASVLTAIVRTGTRKISPRSDEMVDIPEPDLPDLRVPDTPKAYMSWKSSIVGIEAETLDSQLAEYFGVKEGVLVRSVTRSSAADKAGLKAGDVIVKVDETRVANPREISNAVRSGRAKKHIPVLIVREKREMTVMLPVEEDPGPSNRPVPRRAPQRPR